MISGDCENYAGVKSKRGKECGVYKMCNREDEIN